MDFELEELFGRGPTRPALRSYRTSVRSFIPAFAEAELVLHGHQIPPDPDDEAHRILGGLAHLCKILTSSTP